MSARKKEGSEDGLLYFFPPKKKEIILRGVNFQAKVTWLRMSRVHFGEEIKSIHIFAKIRTDLFSNISISGYITKKKKLVDIYIQKKILMDIYKLPMLY